MAESATDRESGVSDVPVQHLRFANEVMSSEEIARASDEMDKKGVDRPIREGLDLDEDGMPHSRDGVFSIINIYMSFPRSCTFCIT